ncbi:Glycogen synthase [Polaribacter huanghezhanensis]|uniref:glycosyltransferase family 4 protein n=1 Tax=Polaribacter huanghezhanensis TaxID=1354726 RepID=UPI0026476A2B|nr:glycosyltransferase family 4 protein [Polaribacter huanghezhanensis]WKD84910.1 Glycogen synthase [Polaribacter huanghezhanensis]
MTKKLHILFLCSWFPSKEFPTNGDFIEKHAKAVSLKHSVSVLHIVTSKKITKTIIDKNVDDNLTTYVGYVKQTKNPILKAIRFYKTYIQLLKLIGDFDLIHLNILYPFGLFALHQQFTKRKPFLISEHWTGYLNSRKNNISFSQKKLSKLITKKASFVCPVSNELQNGMQHLGLKGTYFPVGNVVDTNLFFPSDKKNKTFTIIHVSGLNDAQKNSTDMLKVAKLLENEIANFCWKFIGGTSENYKNLITDLNFKTAKIEFINHVSQKELATHLQEANLCVSFSNYETFGIVMPEAIACGTFLISTNTGILNELKPQDFFSIIPVKDKNALTTEIVKQYKNPTKLNTEKMHLFVQNRFSQEIIADAFSKLYFKTLNKNS